MNKKPISKGRIHVGKFFPGEEKVYASFCADGTIKLFNEETFILGYKKYSEGYDFRNAGDRAKERDVYRRIDMKKLDKQGRIRLSKIVSWKFAEIGWSSKGWVELRRVA